MPVVTPFNVHAVGFYFYTAEASQLRLPPGAWPEIIVTTLGNHQPFVRNHTNSVNGDVTSVVYRQGNGLHVLTVFNT